MPAPESVVLPRWKCHKTVCAAKILIIGNEGPTGIVPLSLFGDINVEVPIIWVNKHEPQAGGYYVIYDDGYASYSPAEPFEAGYSPI